MEESSFSVKTEINARKEAPTQLTLALSKSLSIFAPLSLSVSSSSVCSSHGLECDPFVFSFYPSLSLLLSVCLFAIEVTRIFLYSVSAISLAQLALCVW